MNAIGSTVPSLPASTSFDDPAQLRGQKPEAIAQQFEGLFLSMLVKEMRQSPIDGEGLFPGDASDTYGGIFDTFMGEHLSRNGGIGMAESIATSIRQQSGTGDSCRVANDVSRASW